MGTFQENQPQVVVKLTQTGHRPIVLEMEKLNFNTYFLTEVIWCTIHMYGVSFNLFWPGFQCRVFFLVKFVSKQMCGIVTMPKGTCVGQALLAVLYTRTLPPLSSAFFWGLGYYRVVLLVVRTVESLYSAKVLAFRSYCDLTTMPKGTCGSGLASGIIYTHKSNKCYF